MTYDCKKTTFYIVFLQWGIAKNSIAKNGGAIILFLQIDKPEKSAPGALSPDDSQKYKISRYKN